MGLASSKAMPIRYTYIQLPVIALIEFEAALDLDKELVLE